jgi:hypothetical protein
MAVKGAAEGSGKKSCPVCKSEMAESLWPPPRVGYFLIADAIFFFLVFAWLLSGAFSPQPKPKGAEVFLDYFRLYFGLAAGLFCLGWGWLVLTGKRRLGKPERVWRCPSCEHAEALTSGQ